MLLVNVRVELRDLASGEEVGGGTLIVDENHDSLWPLPSIVPLTPGDHNFEARHPSRTIVPPNPRCVNIPVSTDPHAPVQVICFEVSAAPPPSVA